MREPIYTPVDDDEAIELITGGLAAAERNAIPEPEAIPFCVEGLRTMGYVLCKVETDDDEPYTGAV